jgi:hypothetical protein
MALRRYLALSVLALGCSVSEPGALGGAPAVNPPSTVNLDFMIREFSRDGQTACLNDGYCYSVDRINPITWKGHVRVPADLYRCTADGHQLTRCLRIGKEETGYDCGTLTCTCTVGWDCFKMNLDLAAWGPCHKNGDQVTCCISSDC